MDSLIGIINFYQNKNDEKTFNKFYNEGIMKKINLSDIDKDAMKYFENTSKRFVLPEEHTKGDFGQSYLITTQADKIFIISQLKAFSLCLWKNKERRT